MTQGQLSIFSKSQGEEEKIAIPVVGEIITDKKLGNKVAYYNKSTIKKEKQMGIIRVQSFTIEGVFYDVDPIRKTCSCPAGRRGTVCKHIQKVLGIKKSSSRFSNSLLKSALQKAIRRNMPEKAVIYAKELLESDANHFWRRLGILIIEDSILHPKFRRVVELASESARKSFNSTAEDKQMAVEVVEQIAKSDLRDTEFLEYLQKRRMEYVPLNYESLKEEEVVEIIKAIKWRESLGGMRDDMEMLSISAALWSQRFSEGKMKFKDLNNFFEAPTVEYSKVPKMRGSDIMLEAVDFHCSPLLSILLKKNKIVDDIAKKFGKENVESKLKDIVWRLRSGTNYKKDFVGGKEFDWMTAYEKGIYSKGEEDAYIEIYNSIKVEIDNISRWYISKKTE